MYLSFVFLDTRAATQFTSPFIDWKGFFRGKIIFHFCSYCLCIVCVLCANACGGQKLLQYSPLSLSTLSFETRFLPDPGAHQINKTSWQHTSEILFLPPQACTTTSSFVLGAQDPKAGPHRLVWQLLYQLFLSRPHIVLCIQPLNPSEEQQGKFSPIL